MIWKRRHLAERQLFDCYLCQHQHEFVDPPSAEHLAECRQCRDRYQELRERLDAVRAQADVDSDAVFAPERLATQRQHISRRLAHLGHVAHVLPFPRRSALEPSAVARSRAASRWVAASAAAGLFVGVTLGASYARTPVGFRSAAHRAIAGAPAGTAARSAQFADATEPSADDTFLSELATAAERPRFGELQAVDDLTPHVREVVQIQ